MTTPVRSRSRSGFPASSWASCEAATAKCTKRSVWRASLVSIQSVGTKSGTSPASFTGRPEGSNRSMWRMPFRPSVTPAQNASTPVPTGVTGPIPVTTTRGRSVASGTWLGRHPELRGDQVDGLPDRLHALHLLLGDLDPHLVLQGQHGLGEVEGVGVQVLGEACLYGHLRLVHGQLFGQHLSNPVLDLLSIHRVLLPRRTARL